jgi:chemotaxis signal transduction protein
MHDYLIFTLDGRRCALPLSSVERVERAVEITPLASANLPDGVRGVVNVHGALLPVFDLRAPRADRTLDAEEQMILLTLAPGQRAALLAESVEGVRAVQTEDSTTMQSLLPPGLMARGGVLKVDGDLVLLHDVELLLSNAAAWQALRRTLQTEAPL